MSSLEAVTSGLARFRSAIKLCLEDRCNLWPLASAPRLLDTLHQVGSLMQSGEVKAAVEGAAENIRAALKASLEDVSEGFAGVLAQSVSQTVLISRDSVGRALQPVLARARPIFAFTSVAHLLRRGTADEYNGGGGGGDGGGAVGDDSCHDDLFFGVYSQTKHAVATLQRTLDEQTAILENQASSASSSQRAIRCAVSVYAFAVGIVRLLYPRLAAGGVALDDVASLVDDVKACGSQLKVAFDKAKALLLSEVQSQASSVGLVRAISDVQSFATFLADANGGEYVANDNALDDHTRDYNVRVHDSPGSSSGGGSARGGGRQRIMDPDRKRRHRGRYSAANRGWRADESEEDDSDGLYLSEDEHSEAHSGASGGDGNAWDDDNDDGASSGQSVVDDDGKSRSSEAVEEITTPDFDGPDPAAMERDTCDALLMLANKLRQQHADALASLTSAYDGLQATTVPDFAAACAVVARQHNWLGALVEAMTTAQQASISNLTLDSLAVLQKSLLGSAATTLGALPRQLAAAVAAVRDSNSNNITTTTSNSFVLETDLLVRVYYGAEILDDTIHRLQAPTAAIDGQLERGGGDAHMACARELGDNFITPLAQCLEQRLARLIKGAPTRYYSRDEYDRVSKDLLKLLLTVKTVEVRPQVGEGGRGGC